MQLDLTHLVVELLFSFKSYSGQFSAKYFGLAFKSYILYRQTTSFWNYYSSTFQESELTFSAQDKIITGRESRDS